jgi:hypothetical protein
MFRDYLLHIYPSRWDPVGSPETSVSNVLDISTVEDRTDR